MNTSLNGKAAWVIKRIIPMLPPYVTIFWLNASNEFTLQAKCRGELARFRPDVAETEEQWLEACKTAITNL